MNKPIMASLKDLTPFQRVKYRLARWRLIVMFDQKEALKEDLEKKIIPQEEIRNLHHLAAIYKKKEIKALLAENDKKKTPRSKL